MTDDQSDPSKSGGWPNASQVDRLFGGIDRLCLALNRTPRHARLWSGLLLAFAGFMIWVMLTTPNVIVNGLLKDTFVPLDAGWRFVNGQLPHLDYYTPLGIVFAAIHGWAMEIFGPTARVLMLANLVALPVLMLAVFIGIRGRVPYWAAVCLLAYTFLMTITPWGLTYLANYNRHGWLLTIAVLLIVLLPPQRSNKVFAVVETLVIAACLILASYYKLTYAALGLYACGLAFISIRETRWIAFAGVALWAAFIFGVELYCNFNFLYAKDIMRAITSSGVANGPWEKMPGAAKLFEDISAHFVSVLTLIGLHLCLISSGYKIRSTQRVIILSLALLPAVYFVSNQATHQPVMGLVVLFAMIVQVAVASDLGIDRRPRWIAGCAVLLRAAFVGANAKTLESIALLGIQKFAPEILAVGPMIEKDGGAAKAITIFMQKERADNPSDPLHFLETGQLPHDVFQAMVHTDRFPFLAKRHHATASVEARLIENGYAALKKYAPGKSPIMSVYFSNPFPFLTETEAPRATASWWHYGRTFSAQGDLDPKTTLADVRVVMQPKVDFYLDSTHLWEILGDHVRKNYRIAGQTELWIVWVLKNDGNL
jgi:hypothetical protein